MGKRKNPAAVALGRRGGQVKGVRKGFAALTPERLAELHDRALAKRRANAAKRRTAKPRKRSQNT